MLLPYRVKNPPKRFPYATVTLIVINVVAYLATTNGIAITEEMAKAWGYCWGKTPLYNMFTSMFLHGDLFHLFGNMLFLWIFGGPVEDRLGAPKYLGMYFLAGISGAMLQVVLDYASAGEARYGIGASGCIMGALGAYWYLFPWSTVCIFYFIFAGLRAWIGSFDLEALWVIGFYFLLDLFHGFLFGTFGGGSSTAHFAHVGGVFAGLLFCLAIRAKRDTEAMSQARAVQADMKDISLLPLDALETMLEDDPSNPEVIRAFIPAAMNLGKMAQVDEVMATAGPALIDKDPEIVAYYLVKLRGKPAPYQPMHLLRLAGRMEKSQHGREAAGVYRTLVETYPTAPEMEMALYRMAVVLWDQLQDADNAKLCLRELAKRFPKGEMAAFGRDLWNRISAASPAPAGTGSGTTG